MASGPGCCRAVRRQKSTKAESSRKETSAGSVDRWRRGPAVGRSAGGESRLRVEAKLARSLTVREE